MKKILILIFSIIHLFVYSQEKGTVKNKKIPQQVGKVNMKKKTFANLCKETKRYSAIKRNKLYPFNQSNRIELVSFEDMENYKDNYIYDTIYSNKEKNNISIPPFQLFQYSSKYRNAQTLIQKESFSLPPFKNVKVLSIASRDSLSHILFNIKYSGIIQMSSENKCYQPRNAIIFYDKEDKLLEYLEVCFSCEGKRMSWNAKNIDWCDTKYTNLVHFFRQSGIEFGTYPMLLP